jgi:hypothetical protein
MSLALEPPSATDTRPFRTGCRPYAEPVLGVGPGAGPGAVPIPEPVAYAYHS